MDPYLEDPAFWPDFHFTFIGCWREAIAEVLPEAYEARLDETIVSVRRATAGLPLCSRVYVRDFAILRRHSLPMK
jgi:hypothetical protein